MATCRACGGVLGRDCFNEQDCLMILHSRQPYDPQEIEMRDQHIAQLEKEIAELKESLRQGGCSQEVHADTLFGIYCGGNPESLPVNGHKIFWEGWQRIADYLNARQGGWIAVSPDKPKQRHEVLFSCKYYDEPSTEVGFLCEDGNWQLVRTDSQDMPIIVPGDCVTGWQPIPAPLPPGETRARDGAER